MNITCHTTTQHWGKMIYHAKLLACRYRPYLCKETTVFVAYYCAILLCAYDSVFHVLTGVLMLYQLLPFDILIVYTCTYICLHS